MRHVVTIYQKNLYLGAHNEYRETVLEVQIGKLQRRGTYAPPPE